MISLRSSSCASAANSCGSRSASLSVGITMDTRPDGFFISACSANACLGHGMPFLAERLSRDLGPPCAKLNRRAKHQAVDPTPRPAAEEGILPGGGVALLRASEHLKGIRTKNDDQKTGVEIVRKALSSPARQIAINAGEDGSVIVGKIIEKDQYAYGFDAQTGEYANLISKGIIDPTKVVRTAIQNAASVAALLITTEAMVAELPKKQPPAAGMPPGGGMGGMDF